MLVSSTCLTSGTLNLAYLYNIMNNILVSIKYYLFAQILRLIILVKEESHYNL